MSDKSYSIFYMQRENNMAKTIKFVYPMILFLSLFIVAKEVHGEPFFLPFQFLFTFVVCKQSFTSL